MFSKRRGSAPCTHPEGHAYQSLMTFSTNWGGGESYKCKHCDDVRSVEYNSLIAIGVFVVVLVLLALGASYLILTLA